MSKTKKFEKFMLIWYKVMGVYPEYCITPMEQLAVLRFYKNLKRRKKWLTNN